MEARRVRDRPVVVLDTNMLMVPYQFRVNIFSEISRLVPGAKIVTIPQVLKELKELERRGKKEQLGARLALKLIKEKRVDVLDVDKDVPTDRALVQLAEQGFIIATNDKELKKRVWKVGGTVIALRERNRLEIF